MIPLHSPIRYSPTLSVRPAEVKAYRELPETSKDDILPVFLLRPWLVANELQQARERILSAVGERPFFLDIDYDYNSEGERNAQVEFNNLRQSPQSEDRWARECQLFDTAIPAVQAIQDDELDRQLDAVLELNRGILFRITSKNIAKIELISSKIQKCLDQGKVYLNIDLGDKFTREIETLSYFSVANEFINHENLEYAFFTGTSFPSVFKDARNSTDIRRSVIQERAGFDNVRQKLQSPKLIYGDRASTRLPSKSGGGGAPAPRVDYPTAYEWLHFRQEADGIERQHAYEIACRSVLQSPEWNPEIRIWGTQAIERTALGENDIRSPASATAVRINIHLHIQRSFGNDEILLATDDDYED